jgi:predicted RNA binding protein YcfA (HicA-like mRNA interferase family)
MPRRYRPREVIRVLERLGWRVVRQRGSHVRLRLPGGRNPVTVPVSQRELRNDVFQSILKQAGLTREQFENVE